MGHLCAVDAAMERRRNKTRCAADEAIRGANKQIDKPLLVARIDREGIYQRNDAFIRRLAHGEYLASFLRQDR
jgi:hypothetical protein